MSAPTTPTKRVRKKPALKIEIPSVCSDYVEMPPDLKNLILSASHTSDDFKYIDEDDNTFAAVNPRVPDNIRSPTPIVKITGPDDENPAECKNGAEGGNGLRKRSISAPDFLKDFDVEALRKGFCNVSRCCYKAIIYIFI